MLNLPGSELLLYREVSITDRKEGLKSPFLIQGLRSLGNTTKYLSPGLIGQVSYCICTVFSSLPISAGNSFVSMGTADAVPDKCCQHLEKLFSQSSSKFSHYEKKFLGSEKFLEEFCFPSFSPEKTTRH